MSLHLKIANIQTYTQHMPKMQYLTERELLSRSITGCMLDECEIRTRDGKKSLKWADDVGFTIS